MEKTVQPKKIEITYPLSPTKPGHPSYCDTCGHEKPQWYCAADEAYLLNGCDASVHGDKSLSQRATLDCNESVQKVPDHASRALDEMHLSQIKNGSSNDSDSCCWKMGSLQKLKDRSLAECHAATVSQNSFVKVGGITYTKATKVKLELDSQFQDQHGSCELSFDYNNWRESENFSSIHEVPVLVPVAMPSVTLAEASRHAWSSSSATPLEDALACDFMGFLVPDYCDVDEYLVSNIDLNISKEEQEVSAVAGEEVITGDEEVEWKMYCEFKSDESRPEFSLVNESHRSIFYDYERHFDQGTDAFRLKYSDMNVLKQTEKPKANCTETGFVPLTWVCEKLKVERAGDTDQINQQLEAMIERPIHSNSKDTCNQKSFLTLNYEDVLSAWSDRGCFWTGGQWPQTVPHDFTSGSMDEASLDVAVVPDLDPGSVTSVVQKEEAPVFATTDQTDGGREARVLRYREKRRTRLFSKKIRYEVRKRNAERRPRIKVA
ncbi:hypothetical protein O6H91_02G097500 [Diphasiastrum complanatum]|uniref:Uncharacterized protein n=1 Tax=Diphasiastrum complanatum TaxID=34168 RepID=A0ACC2EIP4_DIPCM|nr:hypothetical protein O6H91_02G097500 [Diphasiastrum complanatum]